MRLPPCFGCQHCGGSRRIRATRPGPNGRPRIYDLPCNAMTRTPRPRATGALRLLGWAAACIAVGLVTTPVVQVLS